MDKATALTFIERIEAHRAAEGAIWQEMRDRDDYENNEDGAIREIIGQRKAARDLIEETEGSLGAFDWVDDGTGNFVPHEELESDRP